MDTTGTFAAFGVNAAGDTPKPTAKSYAEYSTVFKEMLSKFAGEDGEKTRVENRRKYRRHIVNVEQMRKDKKLLPDETTIPDRTTDSNIRNAKHPYIRYLVEPTTVLSYVDASQPGVNMQPLAVSYTDLIREPGWQVEWFFLVDAIQTHGCGYLEVVPAKNKVGTSIQYVRRDHLVFPSNTRSLNGAGTIIRIFEFTKAQFEEFAAENKFNQTVVDVVKKHMEARNEFTKVFRAYLREDGVIKLAYFAEDTTGATDWLKAPAPYSLGELEVGPPDAAGKPTFKSIPLTTCPIQPFPLELEEDEEILNIQGRVALDAHIQDALTAVVSSTVNTCYRASGLYPTREDPDAAGKPPEAIDLRHGMLNHGKFSMTKLDWPNAIAISIAQFLRTTGAQQAGAVDYAAMNRADTAKTAYEISAAREEADKLSSMAVTLFALCSLAVELRRWNVWRSLVKATVLPTPACCQPGPNGEPPMINLFSPTLVPTMSADQQVVRQAEQAAKYLQYYQLAAGTPYQIPMLESMLSDAFPMQFQKWQEKASMLAQAQQTAMGHLQTLAATFNQLRQLDISTLPPDNQQTMAQLLNELGSYLQQNSPQPAK